MAVRVSANYHWAEMTSGACMFVSIRYISINILCEFIIFY